MRTGDSVKSVAQPNQIFGEGLQAIGNKLIQLTWKNNVIYEYRKDTLALIRKVDVNLGREGWGLAADPLGTTLYITDSTDVSLPYATYATVLASPCSPITKVQHAITFVRDFFEFS